jgi:hypothetical protein
MADSGAWITLAAALGGVALTRTLSLATAVLNHRWSEQARLEADHEQETRAVRDQRREACHNYLVATNSFYQVAARLGHCRRFSTRIDDGLADAHFATSGSLVRPVHGLTLGGADVVGLPRIDVGNERLSRSGDEAQDGR